MKASKQRDLWTKEEEAQLRQLFLQHALPAKSRKLSDGPNLPLNPKLMPLA